jgi:hypothetical protein
VATLRKVPKTAFKKGWKGGPGRPPGMRNRLTEVALQALGDDFSEHGTAVIAEVRKTKPHVYLQVVASLLPRQMQIERTSVLGELSDAELHQIEELLAAMRARTVREINGAELEPNFPPASPDPADSK